jgi:hypothetical protein
VARGRVLVVGPWLTLLATPRDVAASQPTSRRSGR